MTTRRLTSVLVLATLAGFVSTIAWAEDKPTPPPDVPDGWLAVEQEYWIPLINEPSDLFHQARERFMDKDFVGAARDLRAAASRLRMDARRATMADRRMALYTESWRLSRVANDVKAKNIRSVIDLDREFARANYTLAEHAYALAHEAWKDKMPLTAGYNLTAAVNNIENAFGWLHEQMGSAAANATTDGTALADKLIAKASASENDVDHTLTGINEAIRELGRVVSATPTLVAGEESNVTMSTPPPVADGWLVVDENVWYDLADATGRELQRAYDAQLRGDHMAAATELRQAASDLQLQISRASGADRTALMKSLSELQDLANSTQGRSASVTARQYQKIIAETCYRLAEHHHNQAEQAWKAKALDTTGHDLLAATNYLERGMVWAGQYADTTAEMQLRHARDAADKLISGLPCAEQDVMNACNAVQTEVGKLRTAVMKTKG